MTFVEFTTGLEDLLASMARVHRHGPPQSVNSADLPVAWVEIPSGTSSYISFADGQWVEYRSTVVVIYQPVGQGDVEDAYTAGLAWMDALAAALYGAKVCSSRLRFDVKLAITTIAGTDYWSVRAEIEGRSTYA